MNESILNSINILIVEWFGKNRRNFPWRDEGINPYGILISEILLRKTNSKMVAEFFPRFIQKYSNFIEINKTEKKVLENDLKPLGLYTERARTLKLIAKEIVIRQNNQLPREFDKLIKIYGIGKYIANAFLCFGLNSNVILVDTNINRIFSRVLNINYPKKISDKHPLWQDLKENINFLNNRLFFMALLDLGSLICKKRNYLCEKCPLQNICRFKKRIS